MLEIILWLVGALGVTGVLLLFIFAPTAAGALLERAERFFAAVLQTRIGCSLLTAIAVYVVTDLYRAEVDAAACAVRITEVRAKAAEAGLDRDRVIGEQLRSQFNPVLAQLKKAAADRNQEADAYARNQLALLAGAAATGKPFDACPLGAGALRLRNGRKAGHAVEGRPAGRL